MGAPAGAGGGSGSYPRPALPEGGGSPPPGPLPVQHGTVGDLPTARSSVEELTLSWGEGMVVADRFRIVRCIGQGGMGTVYLAHDQSLDRPIALKRVPQEILFDGDARDDLRQEANRLLDLAHENIIRVHTYYDEPAWPFFAMEFLQGPTLKDLLRSRKLEGSRFSPEDLLLVARQVERGLTYAHEKGVIHRDLKPGNLMFAAPPGKPVTGRDIIKITDFGISRVVADSTMRQTGRRSGTLPYMSPEQFRGEATSFQSDVYSLAAAYYECLAGRPPFYSGDIGYQVVHIPPRPLPGVPRHLGDALLRGLEKNPRHRPQSVKELTDLMEAAVEGRGRPGRVRSAIGRSWGRRSWISPRNAALAGAALLTAAVVWIITTGGGGGQELPGGRTQSGEAQKLSAQDADALSRMAREIQSQLDDAGLRSAINRTPFHFTLRKRGELTADVLKRVQFALFLLDPSGSEVEVRKVLGTEPWKEGKPVPDALEFEIDGIGEGEYELRTVLVQGQFPAGAPKNRALKLDLTGPSFEPDPVNREELIELDLGRRFVTYNEETELRLSTPGNPGDIDTAYYQIYAESLGRFGGEKQRIADPARWRVTLVPGQNRFQVAAADELGNESARVVRIDRLRLDVVKFEIDRMAGGVVGNRAAVRGELNLERPAGLTLERGLGVPVLRYLVNGQLVVPEEAAAPTGESPLFKALLFLPRQSNVIELRYQWGDDTLRPFAVANAARLVQEVPAPRVELADLPHETRVTSLMVSGRVRPYFEGLEVHLLHEQMGSYRLQLRPGQGEAAFSELRDLVENKLNRFTVTCVYGGQALSPAGPSAAVYCDINPPRLLDPVEFRPEPQGNTLQVVVVPSEEPLQSLSMKGPEGEWRRLSSRNDGRYVAQVPVPREKVEFQFKMIDLAGNETVVTQVCPVFEPGQVAGAEGAEGRTQPGVAREGEGALVTGSKRRTVKRSETLRELELDFVAYGGLSAEEMGVSEVNQKAWNAFLRDRLGQKTPEGDPRKPMTIGERFDPELLTYFAHWLTEKSDDGYRYHVPTANQWTCAFSGSAYPPEAGEALRRWFRGDDPRRRFNASPRSRYGVNEVLNIGERPENRTPTGILDMESNVQEIVRDDTGLWYVIGGYNLLRENDLLHFCAQKRLYSTATESWAGKFTGFRLARRPEKRG